MHFFKPFFISFRYSEGIKHWHTDSQIARLHNFDNCCSSTFQHSESFTRFFCTKHCRVRCVWKSWGPALGSYMSAARVRVRIRCSHRWEQLSALRTAGRKRRASRSTSHDRSCVWNEEHCGFRNVFWSRKFHFFCIYGWLAGLSRKFRLFIRRGKTTWCKSCSSCHKQVVLVQEDI